MDKRKTVMKIGRKLTAALMIMLLASAGLLASCGINKEKEITSLEQLDRHGRKIGIATDTNEYQIVADTFPKATPEYMKDDISGYLAVSQGKIDAFVGNRLAMVMAVKNGQTGVRILDDSIGNGNVGAVAISPRTKIPGLTEKINEFLDEIKADGTLDDMRKRWTEDLVMEMPDIPKAKDPKIHLIVGTTGLSAPFTCYVDDKLAGYDIELAKRFAAWLGASIEFKIYDYEGITAAAQAGDVDCIFANLYVTPEREQVIEFSEPTYVVDIGVMVHDTSSGASEVPQYDSLDDFKDKRIGVVTGTIQGAAVEKEFPDAQVSYYNNDSDCLAALRQNKIDAFGDSDIVIRYMMTQNSDLTYLKDEYLTEPVEVGAIFSKSENGDKLRAEFNEFIKQMKDDGTLEKLDGIWYGTDDSIKKVIDPADLNDEKGVLRLATDTSMPPVSYRGEDRVFGLDIDIATRFCEKYGYGLEIVDTSFPSIVNAVSTEKCDFGIGGIGITAERAESVNFSDTIYEGNSVMAYVREEQAASGGFLSSIKDSFEKTFIREGRWKLFVEGIETTLLITVLSIILGTLLGFAVFMACRKGKRFANDVTRFCIWLIEGMPVVVFLMILYYIVFGRAKVSGVTVSIIAFTLIFAAAVYSMLGTGVSAVGTGQLEAAYSLGYRDRKAFYRIILPQALPHIMPSYKSQITALIKATAVVGYVAVQDLTKMGDIVRSRTYEAFFPLIAVAVFYFILAGILTWIVNKIEIRTVPGSRRDRDMKAE